MKSKLNGWRRVAVLVIGLWVLAAAGLAFYEWTPGKVQARPQ